MEKLLKLYIIIGVFSIMGITSCSDDEGFSSSSLNTLSFSVDTLSLDTTFSNVPTITKSFWVYNLSDKGIRCSSIALESGNQMGFRVNVDGMYLGQASGYQCQDVEIRKGDSIRVFVELTSSAQNVNVPRLVEDNLIFHLENGIQQKVNLNAYSWDAVFMKDVVIPQGKDSVWSVSKPIVVYGGVKVDSAAVLHVKAGTTLFFHEDAILNVYGTLKLEGDVENEIVLRGDRLGRMFDNLPYDRTPGRWQGIHFWPSSYGNEITSANIHGAYNAIVVDSCDLKRDKLYLNKSVIHNNQGDGIHVEYAKLKIENCQLTNALGHCLYVCGGDVDLNQCTVAQFYPFDSNRGSAVFFMAPLKNLSVKNSVITGYAGDEVAWTPIEGKNMNFAFDHSVLRTERMMTEDSLKFTHVLYENLADTVQFGEKHFQTIDTKNMYYDFHLAKKSAAIGLANPQTALPSDRNGIKRNEDAPDAGCYQNLFHVGVNKVKRH